MLQHHTNLVTVKPPPVQPELSRSTRMCQRILWSNLLRYHGEAENPRMTIGVQSTNEERKCAARHNVFTLPPQDQPYVPTAQGPLNGKRATAAYIIQMAKMDMQMRLHFTICITMAPAGTFFTFLLILVAGNKGEKRKLSTSQNMVWNFWKAFLLFGDMR